MQKNKKIFVLFRFILMYFICFILTSVQSLMYFILSLNYLLVNIFISCYWKALCPVNIMYERNYYEM